MNKFTSWLTSKRGRSTKLAKALDVSVGSVSNSHRKPDGYIPPGWIPTIVRLSEGELTYDDLMQLSNRAVRRMRSKGLMPSDESSLIGVLTAMDRRLRPR